MAAPSVEAQCQAVMTRLDELIAPEAASDNDENPASVDARAIASLPDPTGWGGRAFVPWGHPLGLGMVSRDVVPVRAGRSGWYLQYGEGLYDTVRDAFAAARLNKPVSAPWTATRPVHRCGCLTVAAVRHVAIEGAIDVDAQLELMRKTLRHVALAAPDLDLPRLADDLFGSQRVLAEHYLWQLEADGFVDHAGEERQNSMMLTAEGCSILMMLELTKPGANEEPMSPKALAAAAADAEVSTEMNQIDPVPRGAAQLDVPRFLTNDRIDRAAGGTDGRPRRRQASGPLVNALQVALR